MTQTSGYRVPAAFRKLLPDISGNTVNGLGEPNPRPPTPIMWHSPERIAHADVQHLIETRFDTEAALTRFHQRYGGRDAAPSELAPKPGDDATPTGHAVALKSFARANEADLVGIARVDPAWVFEGYDVAEPWVVILGVRMDHAELAQAPAMPAQVETVRQYNRGTRAARAVAKWIEARGHGARAHGGPRAGPLNMIPAAIACGFGELGKHGSIINRTHGSSFRLASVLTDLPLVADEPDWFAADDFCTGCRLCSTACPPGAIFESKQLVRGVEKWFVDFDKCIPYFADTCGCGICIAVCPWSRPGVAPNLAVKMTRRHDRKSDDGA
jgi:ferredoxin